MTSEPSCERHGAVSPSTGRGAVAEIAHAGNTICARGMQRRDRSLAGPPLTRPPGATDRSRLLRARRRYRQGEECHASGSSLDGAGAQAHRGDLGLLGNRAQDSRRGPGTHIRDFVWSSVARLLEINVNRMSATKVVTVGAVAALGQQAVTTQTANQENDHDISDSSACDCRSCSRVVGDIDHRDQCPSPS